MRYKSINPTLLFALTAVVAATEAQDISGFTLEDLAKIPVVESSKKPDRLFNAPVSAFIFDEEDIEYLPVDSLPEMLRYAPGVHMSRATNGIWGLGIRGMGSRFLGRTLFTVDEQNIYSTLYAGLFGNQHDLFLPDVASVEVVYGPGGTLWGTNAVNGMVNVILKSAFETEDTVALTQYGSMNKQVGVRSGWAIGEDTSARVYTKYGYREPSKSQFYEDDWQTLRVGMQVDHRWDSRNLLKFSGEYYASELGWGQLYGNQQIGTVEINSTPEKQSGFNVQGKWTHQQDKNNGFTLRSWYGYTEMDSGYVLFDLGVLGAEFRMSYALTERDRFIFNLGGTFEAYNLRNSQFSKFSEAYEEHSYTANMGAEYTRVLVQEKLDLTLGLNYLYGSHTSYSVLLPSARLLYSPNKKTRLWASFSSAERSSVAGLYDVEEILYSVAAIPPVTIPTPFGDQQIDQQFTYGTSNQNIKGESMIAFELGIRHQFRKNISIRANLFHHDYQNMMGGIVENSQPVLGVPQPYIKSFYNVTNIADGHSDGLEFSTEFAINPSSSFTLNYSILKDDFDPNVFPESITTQILLNRSTETISNSDPEQLLSANWSQRWNQYIRSDVGIRYSSGFSSVIGEREPILQGDLRLSWEPNRAFRMSLVGRNLLKEQTSESPLRDMLSIPTDQPREWYLEIRYQF